MSSEFKFYLCFNITNRILFLFYYWIKFFRPITIKRYNLPKSTIFWEKHSSNYRQQMLKNQLYSCIHRVVCNDWTIAASQKYASDYVLMGFLKVELTQSQLWLHFLPSLLQHNFRKWLFTFSEDWLGNLSMFGFYLYIYVSFHHSEHSLDKKINTCTMKLCKYLA